MGKYDAWEGAVDVNGDKTPITRKPIELVSADEWATMSLGELQQQKGILQARMNIAASHSPQLLPAMRKGIAQLDAIIGSIYTDDTGLI